MPERVCKEIDELAALLPKDKPLWYGSKDMAPYSEKIDGIVLSLTLSDAEFYRSDAAFRSELDRKEKTLREKMKTFYERNERTDGYYDEQSQDRTKPKEIKSIERLRYDYRRRLGNIVLNKVRYTQSHTFTYDRKQKRKSNDKVLKAKIAISQRAVGKSLNRFFGSFVSLFIQEQNSHRRRLSEIEKELKQDFEKEQRRNAVAEENRKAKAEAEEESKTAQNNHNSNQKG